MAPTDKPIPPSSPKNSPDESNRVIEPQPPVKSSNEPVTGPKSPMGPTKGVTADIQVATPPLNIQKTEPNISNPSNLNRDTNGVNTLNEPNSVNENSKIVKQSVVIDIPDEDSRLAQMDFNTKLKNILDLHSSDSASAMKAKAAITELMESTTGIPLPSSPTTVESNLTRIVPSPNNPSTLSSDQTPSKTSERPMINSSSGAVPPSHNIPAETPISPMNIPITTPIKQDRVNPHTETPNIPASHIVSPPPNPTPDSPSPNAPRPNITPTNISTPPSTPIKPDTKGK